MSSMPYSTLKSVETNIHISTAGGQRSYDIHSRNVTSKMKSYVLLTSILAYLTFVLLYSFPSPSVVAERRSEKNNISNRFLLARRLFSSPLRSFSSPSKQSDSSSGGDSLNAWRRSSDSSNNSFIGSSPSTTSRANLSLTFMNVSDI